MIIGYAETPVDGRVIDPTWWEAAPDECMCCGIELNFITVAWCDDHDQTCAKCDHDLVHPAVMVW